MEGYAAATITATTATAGLAVAETALLGPIGLVIVAVGALAAAYVYMGEAAERAKISQKSLTEDYVKNTKDNLEEDLQGLVKKGMSESAARKKISEDRRAFYQDDLKRAQEDLQLMEMRAKALEGLDSAPSEIDIVEARGRVSRAQGSLDALNNFATTKALSKGPASAGTKPATTST